MPATRHSKESIDVGMTASQGKFEDDNENIRGELVDVCNAVWQDLVQWKLGVYDSMLRFEPDDGVLQFNDSLLVSIQLLDLVSDALRKVGAIGAPDGLSR